MIIPKLYRLIQILLFLILIEVKLFLIFQGIALKDLGRNEEAIADYSKAIEIDPKDAKPYFNRGNYSSK